MPHNILFVLTSHDTMGSSGNPTGWYLPEFAHPLNILRGANATFTVASPKGGKAPLDPSSVEMFKDDKESQDFLKEEKIWSNTEKLSDFVGRAKEFDAIVIPGGHGPMFDLATDTTSQQIIREFYESGKVVAAVCHGPAAFVNVKLSDGSHLVNGEPVTGFTNAEEDSVGLSKYMPFMLETDLVKNGAKFEKADPWQEKIVVAGKDGRLITGQNPASAGPLGKAVLKALGG